MLSMDKINIYIINVNGIDVLPSCWNIWQQCSYTFIDSKMSIKSQINNCLTCFKGNCIVRIPAMIPQESQFNNFPTIFAIKFN